MIKVGGDMWPFSRQSKSEVEVPERVEPTRADVENQLSGRHIPVRQHINHINAYFGLSEFARGEGPANHLAACIVAENYWRYAIESGWAREENGFRRWVAND